MDRYAHQIRTIRGWDTIADLEQEADGLMVTCACRAATALPFYVLVRAHRVRQGDTLTSVLRRLRCKTCGAGPPSLVEVKLWKPSDGQPP